VVADGVGGDVVAGEVVTGEVVTGDVVAGEASVVVGSESDEEPEHADSSSIPIADATNGRRLLIAVSYEASVGISAANSTTPLGSPQVAILLHEVVRVRERHRSTGR